MLLRKLRLVILLIIACLYAVSYIKAQAPTGPSLFIDAQDIQRAIRLARHETWAKKAEKDLLSNAAAFPQSYEQKYGLEGPDLPPEGAQWPHFYGCPKTGTELVFHPPDQHVCPDDGKIYKGYPYDQVVYGFRADDLGNAARTLALAYRINGDRHYAEESAAILKAYGQRYLTYRIHDIRGATADTGARVFEQTLEESIWLIQMAWAYDLLRGSDVLSSADRRSIENEFFRPAAGVISRAVAPTHNWQIWKDTALAAVGYVLGDKALIDRAIDGPDGALPILRECVLDGFWDEGTLHYQFYTMTAYSQLAEMTMKHGRNLWREEPDLKALFESPIGLMFPNGDLPAFNDSVVYNLHEKYWLYDPSLYEAAFAATGDPLFAGILNSTPRDNEQAWLFGIAKLSKEELPKPSSQLFSHIGFARLTSGGSDLTEVMKWGPHGGPHGHFDILGEIIYSQGRIMSVDPGTQYYGVPSHATWDLQTVAHNTIVVDETSQLESTGRLLDWQVTPQYTTLEADSGHAYKNVILTRRVVLTSRYILEITNAKAVDGRVHKFDWIYHNVGEQHFDFPLEPWSGFPRTSGYQHLSNNQSAMVNGMWQIDFHVVGDASAGPGNMHVLVAAQAGTRVVTGDGLGPDLRVPVPYVMARRECQETQFAVVIEPHQGKSAIKSLESVGNGRYRITAGNWVDTISVDNHVLIEHVGAY